MGWGSWAIDDGGACAGTDGFGAMERWERLSDAGCGSTGASFGYAEIEICVMVWDSNLTNFVYVWDAKSESLTAWFCNSIPVIWVNSSLCLTYFCLSGPVTFSSFELNIQLFDFTILQTTKASEPISPITTTIPLNFSQMILLSRSRICFKWFWFSYFKVVISYISYISC